MAPQPRVVVVDHRDSFAFILGEQFAVAGAEVLTVRCTEDVADFARWLAGVAPALVVLSPGPGGPESTGLTLPWLRTDPAVPVLGVCLGHQAMAVAAGGRVGQAPAPVHGRSTEVCPVDDGSLGGGDGNGGFATGLGRALAPHLRPGTRVARYHSLTVLDPGREHAVLAETVGPDRVIMAMAHRTRPRLGLQFHPESVLTPYGGRLLHDVLLAAVAHGATQS